MTKLSRQCNEGGLVKLPTAILTVAILLIGSGPGGIDAGDFCGRDYNPPAPLTQSANEASHGGALPLGNPDLPSTHRLGPISFANPAEPSSAAAADADLDLKLLLLSATGNNNSEPAIRLVKEALDGPGIPFDHLHLTSDGRRLSEQLLDLEHSPLNGKRRGKYYGIILISDLLAFQDPSGTWLSSLTQPQWAQLAEYERYFKVRRVSVAAYPRPTYGVEPAGEPLTASNDILMQKSAESFSSGLVPGATLALIGSFQNPCRIIDPSLATPIAYFAKPSSDGQPSPVASAITNFPDGRQQLNFYFAQSPFLMASYYLAPLWVNWITRGIYIGKRRIYLNMQVDDLFLSNGMWNIASRSPSDNGFRVYRATPDDLTALVDWQQDQKKRLPNGSTFRVEMIPNGKGVWSASGYSTDDLFKTAKKYIPEFHWVSHTFTHPDLDRISFKRMTDEIRANQAFLQDFIGLDHKNFSPHSVVTPHISGLFNKEALRALMENGIYNVVGDNSRRELWPLNPFQGFFTSSDANGFEGIFVIPRQATVAPVSAGPISFLTSFYNNLYHNFWGRDLSASEILQLEADRVAKLLLAYRHDPYMFHQGNLWNFNWPDDPGLNQRTRHSILSLWAEFVLRSVRKFSTLPVLSAKMDDMSGLLQSRMKIGRCGVEASLSTKNGRIVGVHVETQFTCSIPITGISVPNSEAVKREVYGPDQTTIIDAKDGSRFDLELDQPITL